MTECFDYVRGIPLMLIYSMTALVSVLHEGIMTFRCRLLDLKIKFV